MRSFVHKLYHIITSFCDGHTMIFTSSWETASHLAVFITTLPGKARTQHEQIGIKLKQQPFGVTGTLAMGREESA